jgi:uncharacterized RDD family membrane protein YckC
MDPPVTPPPAPTPVGSKPDPLTRFLAYLIDAVIVGVVGMVPIIGGLAGIGYVLVRDGLKYDFMDGRSIGKKVMKLRPVRLDGLPMDVNTSVQRNWPLAFASLAQALAFVPVLGWVLAPFVVLTGLILMAYEAYKVLTDPEGRRFGDGLAGTRVVLVAD